MIIMLKLGQLVRSSFIWHYCWGFKFSTSSTGFCSNTKLTIDSNNLRIADKGLQQTTVEIFSLDVV